MDIKHIPYRCGIFLLEILIYLFFDEFLSLRLKDELGKLNN